MNEYNQGHLTSKLMNDMNNTKLMPVYFNNLSIVSNDIRLSYIK